MISYHCSFYIDKNKENNKEQQEIDPSIEKSEVIEKKEEPKIVENIIHFDTNINNEAEKPKENEEDIKAVDKKGTNLLLGLATSPKMFCVSLLRIIKTSLFFLDFGLKIYYPEGETHESAKKIVTTFLNAFKGGLFKPGPWCIFLGFNLGPQLLFFFSFSWQDWQRYNLEYQGNDPDKISRAKFLFKKTLDNFNIQIRLLEVSI